MAHLYFGGTILTMAQPMEAEAVLTKNGKIVAVGRKEELLSLEPEAKEVDLCGAAMLPAFLDAHSHFTAVANSFLQVDLSECVTFEEIFHQITAFCQRVPKGEWVLGQGYDHNHLAEHCHPTLELLDKAAPEHPLLLSHQSGHVGVMNSLALQKLGITTDTPDPEGGRIEKKNGRLTGYLEENAFISYQKKVPMPSPEDFMKAYEQAQQVYLQHGIVLVQEGLLAPQMVPLYRAMLQRGFLQLDLVAYCEESAGENLLREFPKAVGQYDGHFKIGGFKIFLDGSPQGKTAYLRTPYKGEESYCGYPTMTDEAVCGAIEHAVEKKLQLLVHCNGDGAAEQLLRCLESVRRKGTPIEDAHTVMIHAQLLREDQMARVKELGVTLSFFINHVYHWGDVHIKNLGRAWANHISPAKTALSYGIPITFHQDSPVLPPSMLESVWCAVNRRTRNGEILSGEEISTLDALRGVTSAVAKQYGEEMERGTIEAGKSADFVVLSANPLEVPKEQLREIFILQTIKEDCVLYQKESSKGGAYGTDYHT